MIKGGRIKNEGDDWISLPNKLAAEKAEKIAPGKVDCNEVCIICLIGSWERWVSYNLRTFWSLLEFEVKNTDQPCLFFCSSWHSMIIYPNFLQ